MPNKETSFGNLAAVLQHEGVGAQLLNSGLLRNVDNGFEPIMDRYRISSLWEISLSEIEDHNMDDVSFFLFSSDMCHRLIIVLDRKKSYWLVPVSISRTGRI